MAQKPTMDLEIFKSAEARQLASFIARNCVEADARERYLEVLYKVCTGDVTPAPDWFDHLKK